MPGITLRSLAASIFCMLLMGMHLQYGEIILGDSSAMAEQSLPLPALSVFVLMLGLTGGIYTLFRKRLLTRQELFCVLLCMLLSAPMMTQGMWHRFIGLISATPRSSSFTYIDAYSDKLWPHGPNITQNALSQANAAALQAQGNLQWREIEYENGLTATLPVLVNSQPGQVSSLSLEIPLTALGRANLVLGDPYLVSFLARPEPLGADSSYFCRIYYDDQPTYAELINSSQKSRITFLHKTGFLRQGSYAFKFSPDVQDKVRIELGLVGTGELALYDLKIFSVATLEGVYSGRKIIAQSEYDQLPPRDRAGLIVKPDNMWSWAGLKFLVSGYIPLADWGQTALAWSSLILLLLTALFAVNVIMRRQWAQNERYSFPLFQIPSTLLGSDDQAGFAPVWRNPFLWAGLICSVCWGVMRGAQFYNPGLIDLNIQLPLKPYLSGAGWGGTWDGINFTVSAIVLSLCIFMELNVLLSLVLGLFLYRLLFYAGERTGLKVYTGYPFRYEQAIGAFLGYALVVVFFTRKYLWHVLKTAVVGSRAQASAGADADAGESAAEAVSYRWALLMLVGSIAGAALWARWVGVSIQAITLYFAFLVLLGFVCSKLRAECGLPSGYFTPYNAMLFVSLLGGMSVFGAQGMMVCLIASGFLTVSVFFFIPGAQLELLEFGRRLNLRRRHLLYTGLLGALGGLFIGGWVFLSNAYAIGGNNIKYQWAFSQNWFFRAYSTELAGATSQYIRTLNGDAIDPSVGPEIWGYVYGAVGTGLIAVLRQMFAGFWFHPIGFILSSSHMLEFCWGSALCAWVIRFTVLKLGGAATVRNKLLPFFVGVFLGGLIVLVAFNGVSAWMRANGVDRTWGALP